MPSLNSLIIGAGAIGCLVGGKLALAGNPVTLAGRARFAEVVQRQGLRMIEPSGEQTLDTIQAVSSIDEAFATTSSPFDLIILTVKSYDTASALAELQQASQRHQHRLPSVLSLQNGAGNEEMIADIVTPSSIIAGNITTPVSVPEIGVIRVEREKYGIGLAQWREEGAGGEELIAGDAELNRAFQNIQAVLGEAGFAVKVYASAPGMKWTKLLLNIVGNASSAIVDQAPAVVFSDVRMVDLELSAWREALAVMRAASIPVLAMDGYPLDRIAPLVRWLPNPWLRPALRRMVTGGRGQKMPSLHIDLHQNKGKSEIGWLNGAIVAKGRSVGVATPVNQLLTETLLRLLTADENERKGWRGNYARLIEQISSQ